MKIQYTRDSRRGSTGPRDDVPGTIEFPYHCRHRSLLRWLVEKSRLDNSEIDRANSIDLCGRYVASILGIIEDAFELLTK